MWTAYVLQDACVCVCVNMHTYISHSMYFTMRVCVRAYVIHTLTWFFGSVPLMQLATNYERRTKVFCSASTSSSGRQRERELAGNREREGEVIEHILDSHMPKLSHKHTRTHVQQAKFLFGFCKPFLSPFLLSSFARLGFFLAAFFCAFCLCFLSLFLSLRRRRLTLSLCPAATFAFVSCVASFAADLEQFSHFYFPNRLLAHT